jgi:single-strand DNA-binding protein
MARSLNKVLLIGNLTRDPELRYTPSGTAVCTFGLATNRSWTTDTGEKHEEPEFHRIVAWNKLAELCSQFLVKGRQIYVEGRLQTRSWTTQDNQQRSTTEIVIDNMILLDRGHASGATNRSDEQGEEGAEVKAEKPVKKTTKKVETETREEEQAPEVSDEEITPEDIPF